MDKYNQKITDKAKTTKILCQKALDIVLPEVEKQIVFLNTIIDLELNDARQAMGWASIKLNSINDINPSNLNQVGKVQCHVRTLYLSRGYSWYQLEKNDIVVQSIDSKKYQKLQGIANELIERHSLIDSNFDKDVCDAPDESFLFQYINDIKKRIKGRHVAKKGAGDKYGYDDARPMQNTGD